jgi:hypothetical protein
MIQLNRKKVSLFILTALFIIWDMTLTIIITFYLFL